MSRRAGGDDEIGRAIARATGDAYTRIYAITMKIPRGRVMTYGEVAAAAGLRGAARIVGYAMRAGAKRVPWQRVVGKRKAGQAQVTIKDPVGAALQRQLLEKEGVRFAVSGAIDLARFGWSPPGKGGARPQRAASKSAARTRPRARAT